MTITLYTSTAESSRLNKSAYLTTVATLTGQLLVPTSMTAPVILFDMDTVGEAPKANYAYIDDFARYYFITEWTANAQGLWEASMNVDVLMTYKGNKTGTVSGIYKLKAWVNRYENGSAVLAADNIYPEFMDYREENYGPTLSSPSWYGTNDILNDSPTPLSGPYRYVIQLNAKPVFASGESYPQNWNLLTLVTNAEGMRDFIFTVANTSALSGGKTLAESVLTCYALPFEVPHGLTRVRKIDMPGLFSEVTLDTDDYYYMPSSGIMHTDVFHFSVTLPNEPAYMHYAPYTNLKLIFEPFGSFAIDPRIIFTSRYGAQTFDVAVECNMITGSAVLYYGKTGNAVHVLGTGSVKNDITLSGEQYNLAKGVGGIISAVTDGVAAGTRSGNIGVGIATAAIEAGGALIGTAANPDTYVTGGDTQIVWSAPALNYKKSIPTDDAPDLFGYPYHKYVQLSTLSGYAEIGRIHIEGITATDTELLMIENALKEGVIL